VRPLLGISTLVVALTLSAGSAAAAAPPDTPAGEQLAWLLRELNGTSVPSTAELERHFSPAFLKAVPPPALVGGLAQVRAGSPLRLAAVLERDGSLAVKVRVETRSGARYRVSLVVAKAPPHLIEGLLFEPIAAPLASWDEVDTALARLGGHASLYAGLAGGRRVHAVAGDEPGAIGSAFKLYVLGALADAVQHGRASWQEQLAIRDAWKSLPSGAMREQPAGARFSLRHHAEQMISVSDNTATDHLIGRLGRAAVERELTALSNGSAARNEPFLTTRELFALKLAAPASLRDAFAAAGPAGRRALLPRVDALVPTLDSAGSWTAPRAIDRLEWFASPVDLSRAVATLVARARDPRLRPLRPILALNPGVELDRSVWPYVAYKGGSEPGVISLTWYAERKDGRAFVLSLVVNDSRHEVDAAAAIAVAQSAFGLLART
jgi:beta-lactamase class A